MALLLKDLAIDTLPILGVPLLVLVVAGKARQSRLLSILDKLIPPLLMIYWIIWFVRLFNISVGAVPQALRKWFS
jgi:hypothetical protein